MSALEGAAEVVDAVGPILADIDLAVRAAARQLISGLQVDGESLFALPPPSAR